MRTSESERRKQNRDSYFGGKQLKLSYSPKPGVTEVVTANVLDIHEGGCGLSLKVLLPEGTEVLVCGELGSMLHHLTLKEIQVRARVVWCTARGSGGYRAGLVLRNPSIGRAPVNPRKTSGRKKSIWMKLTRTSMRCCN